MSASAERNQVDAVVVGAGFAGLYQVHRLLKAGYRVRAFEKGSDVGGTWYWNRYPGARCDIESICYSYSFDEALQREWRWPQRYAEQPDILRYLQHVAERFNLRPHFAFNTAIEAAHYDEASQRWQVRTATGEEISSRFFIMATGCLSKPLEPNFKGLDLFTGERYQTSRWPHAGVDFTGKRVGMIGTGSSSIQSTPIIAQQAAQLFVFQRTPQFAIPAWNRELTDEEMRTAQESYAELRRLMRQSEVGIDYESPTIGAKEADAASLQKQLEFAWDRGGYLMLAAYPDLLTDLESNKLVSDWVKEKIRARIKDPAVAEKLIPRSYGFGTYRVPLETGYYDVYNQPNVELVDVSQAPIEAFTENGLKTAAGEYALDVIILATGFDAGTGSLTQMNIHGRDGRSLTEEWRKDIRSTLGLQVNGFPNLFTIAGPLAPSTAFCNMTTCLQQQVDWVTDTILYLREHHQTVIEPTVARQDAWVKHHDEIANATLLVRTKSWYTGANIKGKPIRLLSYIGGAANYRQICEEVKASGYPGFALA